MPLKISDLSGLLSSKKGRTIVVIAGVVLILILFLGTLTPESTEQSPAAEDTAAIERELEQRLERLLEGIDGVTAPDVMLTLESTSEHLYARDGSSSSTSGGSSSESAVVLAGSGRSPLEQTTVLPKVRGVAVVCGGAENPSIKEKVVNTVSGVLNISSSRVYVTY